MGKAGRGPGRRGRKEGTRFPLPVLPFAHFQLWKRQLFTEKDYTRIR